MDNKKFYILSGAPGSGKSTIIKQLKKNGYVCVDEPARDIIAEQKAINGEGLYNKDKKLFVELMLSRALYQYKQFYDTDKPVIFDRAIPDLIAYAKLFNVNLNSVTNAALLYRYNPRVIFLPSWQDIYTTDEDRTISFGDASTFGELIRQIYLDLQYEILQLPKAGIDERVEIIVKYIST